MKVFVYGSLRKGFGNHVLLSVASFIGDTWTEPNWQMYSLGAFPAISPGTNKIYGEVYEIDDLHLERLDWLEGYPRFYDRMLIPTKYGEAWTYFIKDPNKKWDSIQSGVWEENSQRSRGNG